MEKENLSWEKEAPAYDAKQGKHNHYPCSPKSNFYFRIEAINLVL